MTDIFTQASISSAFAWIVHQLFNLNPTLAALAMALLVLSGLQLRAGAKRARLVRELEEEMDDLRDANSAVRAALSETKKQVAEVTLAIAKKSDAQERKIAGELQTLQDMVQEFAVQTAMRLQAPAIAAPHNVLLANPAAGLADPAMLEIIQRALEENRVDLHLQPVVSLPQRKVRFYEALSRLRSEDGGIIMPAQYITVAAPVGLMSVVDNLLLFRCVQIVRRLSQKQRDIGVFCNISGHTLSDAEFFPQFLDFMHRHRDLAGHIIFEFTQASVLAAGVAEEANLRYLANLGFRLSLDQVTRLDCDFAKLKRLGFHFLKLKAAVLMSGMKSAGAPVAAEDFKDHLSRSGLALIVERVEEEKTVVQLLEYNVDFGQGYLFGEPRAVREIAEANDPRAPAPPANAKLLPAGLVRRLAG